MKTSIKLLTLAGVLCAGLLNLNAVDNKELAGPKGGRLLEKTEPKVEFFVEKDRSITINFYNAELKPITASTQNVTVIANAKDNKATIEFEKKGDSLVSKAKLPEGEGYNVVVQFKPNPDAKAQNYRFKLDLHTCGECKRAEYACICGH
jgi:hypothetical protein